MPELRLTVERLEQVDTAIRALPGLLAFRVQGRGLRAAAEVVVRGARILAPIGPARRVYRGRAGGGGFFDTQGGALKDSFRAGLSASSPKGVGFKVPGSAAAAFGGGPGAAHVNLIEYGFTTRDGRRIDASGRVNFSPMRKALLSTSGAQLQAFQVAATKALVRTANQIRNKTIVQLPSTIRRYLLATNPRIRR